MSIALPVLCKDCQHPITDHACPTRPQVEELDALRKDSRNLVLILLGLIRTIENTKPGLTAAALDRCAKAKDYLARAGHLSPTSMLRSAQPQPCPDCKGLGEAQGLDPEGAITIQCQCCKGTGQRP